MDSALVVQEIEQNWHIIILSIGALGTASFGIVEGLKWLDFVGLRGYNTLIKSFDASFFNALTKAYGKDYEAFLKAQYRSDRATGGLNRVLRQGVRVGLHEDNAVELANWVGVNGVDAETLKQVAAELSTPRDPDAPVDPAEEDKKRRQLGRFELAIDTRIDAAIVKANSRYTGAMRGLATITAFVLTAVVAYGLLDWPFPEGLWLVFVIGAAAVPVAPIAKDLASSLTSAANALAGARSRRT